MRAATSGSIIDIAAHSSMSAGRHAAQPQLASHMLEDDGHGDAGLSSNSEGDPDDDSVDGMFYAAADAVAAAVAASPAALQQEDKLQLYGLYKQAVEGPCTSARPAFWDLKARSKWEAWRRLDQMPAEAAKVAYTQAACQLLDWDAPHSTGSSRQMRGQSQAAGAEQPGGINGSSKVGSGKQQQSVYGPVVSTLAGGDAGGADEAAPSPLHAAAAADDVSAAEAALASGCDVNLPDGEGATPLHWAADRGSLQVLALLLRRGANINARDEDEQTPLHYATLCEQAEAVRALETAGADVVEAL